MCMYLCFYYKVLNVLNKGLSLFSGIVEMDDD